MEEKKPVTLKLSTVILLFIIFILVIVGINLYYFGFVKEKANTNETRSAEVSVNENINTNKNTLTNTTNQNVVNKENNNIKENNSSEKSNSSSFEISFKEEIYVPKGRSEESSQENKRNLPTIKNTANQSVADKIEKSLIEISDKVWNEIKKSADEYKDIPNASGINYMLSTYLVTDKYIVFKANQTGDFGGVGWTAEELYNFDTKTGELLTLRNVSSDYHSMLTAVINKAKDYLKENSIEISMLESNSDIDQQMKEIIEKTSNWGFSKDGMEFIFPKYSIAGGYAGVITIKMNKDEINKFLVDDYIVK